MNLVPLTDIMPRKMIGIYPRIFDGNEKTVTSTVAELPVIFSKPTGGFAQAEKLTSTTVRFTAVPSITAGKDLHRPQGKGTY